MKGKRDYYSWISKCDDVNPFIEEISGFPLAYTAYRAADWFCREYYEYNFISEDNPYSLARVYSAIKKEMDAQVWDEMDDDDLPHGRADVYRMCWFRFHLDGKEFEAGCCI